MARVRDTQAGLSLETTPLAPPGWCRRATEGFALWLHLSRRTVYPENLRAVLYGVARSSRVDDSRQRWSPSPGRFRPGYMVTHSFCRVVGNVLPIRWVYRFRAGYPAVRPPSVLRFVTQWITLSLAPTAGIEPATIRLTAGRSTIELHRRVWVPPVDGTLQNILGPLQPPWRSWREQGRYRPMSFPCVQSRAGAVAQTLSPGCMALTSPARFCSAEPGRRATTYGVLLIVPAPAVPPASVPGGGVGRIHTAGNW